MFCFKYKIEAVSPTGNPSLLCWAFRLSWLLQTSLSLYQSTLGSFFNICHLLSYYCYCYYYYHYHFVPKVHWDLDHGQIQLWLSLLKRYQVVISKGNNVIPQSNKKIVWTMYFSSGNFHLLKLFLEIFESAKETKWACSSSVKLSFIWKNVLLQCQTIMQSDGYRQKENWACIPREGSSLIAQGFLIYCGGIKGEVPPTDFLPPQLQGVLSNQRWLAWKADLHQTYSPVRSQPLSQGCSPWAASDHATR